MKAEWPEPWTYQVRYRDHTTNVTGAFIELDRKLQDLLGPVLGRELVYGSTLEDILGVVIGAAELVLMGHKFDRDRIWQALRDKNPEKLKSGDQVIVDGVPIFWVGPHTDCDGAQQEGFWSAPDE